MNHRVLLAAGNTQALAFCFPPRSTVWRNEEASGWHRLPAQTQPEESRSLMLSSVKGGPVENGSGIWNDDVIYAESAIVMEPCFPSRTARPRQESASGAAVKIHTEREMAPSQ